MNILCLLIFVLTVSCSSAGRQEKCPNGCSKRVEDSEAVAKIVANLPPSMHELAENHNTDYKNIKHNDVKIGSEESEDSEDSEDTEDSENSEDSEEVKREVATTRRHKSSFRHKYTGTATPMSRTFKKRLNFEDDRVAEKRDHLAKAPEGQDKHDLNQDKKAKLYRNMKILMEGVKRNLDDYSHLKKKK